MRGPAISETQSFPSVRRTPSSDTIKTTCCCGFARITSGRNARARTLSTPDYSEDHIDQSPSSDVDPNVATSATPPPIVVETARWTAVPETFTVRVDPHFTVTCTVVHPVAKSKRAMFKRSKSSNHAQGNKGTARATVEALAAISDFDQAVRVVDKPSDTQWGNIKTSRRNSGWGLFAEEGQGDSVTRRSFIVDHANDHLLVPNVDVGVKFLVKEEYELAEAQGASSESLSMTSSQESTVSLVYSINA